jgi:hypothetical protein
MDLITAGKTLSYPECCDLYLICLFSGLSRVKLIERLISFQHNKDQSKVPTLQTILYKIEIERESSYRGLSILINSMSIYEMKQLMLSYTNTNSNNDRVSGINNIKFQLERYLIAVTEDDLIQMSFIIQDDSILEEDTVIIYPSPMMCISLLIPIGFRINVKAKEIIMIWLARIKLFSFLRLSDHISQLQGLTYGHCHLIIKSSNLVDILLKLDRIGDKILTQSILSYIPSLDIMKLQDRDYINSFKKTKNIKLI